LPVQGNLKDLIKVALQMHQVPFKRGALRVVTTIKIDDRRDREITIAGKRRAVKRKLRRAQKVDFFVLFTILKLHTHDRRAL
jgi:hypothetical protein